MNLLLGILLGLGLAAAAGLRVFVPLLIAGLAARFGRIELVDGFTWLASTPVLIGLALATLLEMAAYQLPWIDHLLDTLATPLAAISGTLIMAATLLELEPSLRWPLAIIAGGGAATVVQSATVGLRLLSSATTGGLGNPLFAAGESSGSLGLGLLAVLVPLAAGLFVLLLLSLGIYLLWRRAHSARPSST